MIDCDTCGIIHPNAAERDAIHSAVARVRRRLRKDLERALRPVVIPGIKKRLDGPHINNNTECLNVRRMA